MSIDCLLELSPEDLEKEGIKFVEDYKPKLVSWIEKDIDVITTDRRYGDVLGEFDEETRRTAYRIMLKMLSRLDSYVDAFEVLGMKARGRLYKTEGRYTYSCTFYECSQGDGMFLMLSSPNGITIKDGFEIGPRVFQRIKSRGAPDGMDVSYYEFKKNAAESREKAKILSLTLPVSQLTTYFCYYISDNKESSEKTCSELGFKMYKVGDLPGAPKFSKLNGNPADFCPFIPKKCKYTDSESVILINVDDIVVSAFNKLGLKKEDIQHLKHVCERFYKNKDSLAYNIQVSSRSELK